MSFWATGLGRYSEGPDANEFRLCPETPFFGVNSTRVMTAPSSGEAGLLCSPCDTYSCVPRPIAHKSGLRSRRRFDPLGRALGMIDR